METKHTPDVDAQEFVMLVHDYANIPSSEFREKYPAFCAEREGICEKYACSKETAALYALVARTERIRKATPPTIERSE